MSGFNFPDLCHALGKDALYIRNIQKHLDLPLPAKGGGYSESYVVFLDGIVALRAFHTPLEDIKELLDTEMKILRLLHVDTLTDSPTWFLDACRASVDEIGNANRFLLTGYTLDFSLDANTVQHTLDFGNRAPELFKGREMGEDIRRVIRKYQAQVQHIRERVEKEMPILENALEWGRHLLSARPKRAVRLARPAEPPGFAGS